MAKEFVADYFADYPLTNLVETIENEVIFETSELSGHSSKPGTFGLIVKTTRWVIKDDDLNLIKTIAEALLAVLTAGCVVDKSVQSLAQGTAGAAILLSIFQIYKSVSKKGKTLSSESFEVLWIVHENGPISSFEILRLLKRLDGNWTIEEVDLILSALSSMPMRDGSVRSLVALDKLSQTWMCSGI